MVVFLDLEEDADHEPPELGGEHWLLQGNGKMAALRSNGDGNAAGKKEEGKERENVNREKAVTAALGCYPYVFSDDYIHNYQDLNTKKKLFAE